MRCNQFDTYIDEMLSGILHPEAARHLRECERCSANYARRAVLQANLRQMAATATAGPSAATDRAVLEAFRRRQHPTARTAGVPGAALSAAYGLYRPARPVECSCSGSTADSQHRQRRSSVARHRSGYGSTARRRAYELAAWSCRGRSHRNVPRWPAWWPSAGSLCVWSAPCRWLPCRRLLRHRRT